MIHKQKTHFKHKNIALTLQSISPDILFIADIQILLGTKYGQFNSNASAGTIHMVDEKSTNGLFVGEEETSRDSLNQGSTL